MNAIVTPIRPKFVLNGAGATSALKQLLGANVAREPGVEARDHSPLFTSCQIGASGAIEDAETLSAAADRDILLVEYSDDAPAPLWCHYGLRVWWSTVWHLHLRPFVALGHDSAVLIPNDRRAQLHFAIGDDGRMEAWNRQPFSTAAEREAGCQRADMLVRRLLQRG